MLVDGLIAIAVKYRVLQNPRHCGTCFSHNFIRLHINFTKVQILVPMTKWRESLLERRHTWHGNQARLLPVLQLTLCCLEMASREGLNWVRQMRCTSFLVVKVRRRTEEIYRLTDGPVSHPPSKHFDPIFEDVFGLRFSMLNVVWISQNILLTHALRSWLEPFRIQT